MTARELRELMQSATERYRTYRARIRDWSNYRLTLESLGQEWDGDEEEGESEWRLWLEIDAPGAPILDDPPSRFRLEHRRRRLLDRLVVRDGDDWWSWRDGELLEPAQPEAGLELFLHFPSPVITWSEPDRDPDVSDDEWLGRPAVRARVFGDDFLGPRSDHTDYLVDRERGVLLRAEAFVRGWPAAVEESLEVVFDDELHRSLFDASVWEEA